MKDLKKSPTKESDLLQPADAMGPMANSSVVAATEMKDTNTMDSALGFSENIKTRYFETVTFDTLFCFGFLKVDVVFKRCICFTGWM